MDQKPSPPPPEPRYPIAIVRGVAGGIVVVMLLFFLSTADRDSILATGPAGFGDLMTAVFIYTFPLALGCFLIIFIWHRLADADVYPHPIIWAAGVAAILFVCGLVSRQSGLGRAPDFMAFKIDTFYRTVAAAFGAYANTYGFPLLICGITAGVYLALELESHL
jgi:hypothetical protein